MSVRFTRLSPTCQPATAGPSSRWDEGTPLVVQFERAVTYLGRLADVLGWAIGLPRPSSRSTRGRLSALFPERSHRVLGANVIIRARDEFFTRLARSRRPTALGCVAVLQRLFETEVVCERGATHGQTHSSARF